MRSENMLQSCVPSARERRAFQLQSYAKYWDESLSLKRIFWLAMSLKCVLIDFYEDWHSSKTAEQTLWDPILHHLNKWQNSNWLQRQQHSVPSHQKPRSDLISWTGGSCLIFCLKDKNKYLKGRAVGSASLGLLEAGSLMLSLLFLMRRLVKPSSSRSWHLARKLFWCSSCPNYQLFLSF